jgi:RNA polymerase sigma factor (TIGR02999 family)
MIRIICSSGAGAMYPQAGDVTSLLARWQRGDRAALEHLAPVIHRELVRLARRRLAREGHRNSVQPSSLVQEAFLRLLPARDVDWRSRAHFFAIASQVMRRVLVDHARERNRAKRSGAAIHIPAHVAVILSPEQLDEVVALDLALEQLAQRDQRKSKVFEMRFFGGLSVEETAEALGVAPNTVIRDWDFARAWLRRELGGEGPAEHGSLAKG